MGRTCCFFHSLLNNERRKFLSEATGCFFLMLLELAVGDAYGAGFEYAASEFVRQHNDLSQYHPHGKYSRIFRRYTDDTQMSLAVVELMLAEAEWTPLTIATYFWNTFRRDPREGYSSRVYSALAETNSPAEFLNRITSDSSGNGAVMRATPLGLYPTVDGIKQKAEIQARVTHNSTLAVAGATAAALLTHYFVYSLGPKAEVGDFLEMHVPGNWTTDWAGSVTERADVCVQAVLTALRRSASLSELLRECVAFTGDVDTVAAVALSAGSWCQELTPDLPAHLIAQLENGDFGADYLVRLDKALTAKFLTRT